MKKILFVVPYLTNGGGVLRSLQNFLLNVKDPDLSFYVLPISYSSKEKIVLPNCTILNYNLILNSIKAVYSETKGYQFRYVLFAFKILFKLLSRLNLRKKFEDLLQQRQVEKYSEYDVVIAFQEGYCTELVSKFVNKRKIAWIHSDYKEYMKVVNRNEYEMYSSFDLIISVSQFTKKSFDSIYPEIAYKSDYLYNYLDINYINQQSNKKITDLVVPENYYLLISIGRIDKVKQFSQIPFIISQLLKMGMTNFKWILLGNNDDVSEFNIINEGLKKYSINNTNFEYIGSRINPYPYIRKADFLISLSKSEACPYVVNEAKVLHVPVISNNYPSIYEFIQDGENGYICPNESLPNLLYKLFSNKESVSQIKRKVLSIDYDNQFVIQKLLRILKY